jgi:hypothetical protein
MLSYIVSFFYFTLIEEEEEEEELINLAYWHFKKSKKINSKN